MAISGRASSTTPASGTSTDRQPLAIVENGKANQQHLRQALMSEDELMSQLRQKGVDDIDKVRHGFIEGDGHVSVITKETSFPTQPTKATPGVDS